MPEAFVPEGMNLPYSLEAERAVLACLLLDPKCLDTLQAGGFRTEYFYRQEHKAIYTAILNIDSRGDQVEPVAVITELQDTNQFGDPASVRQYIRELADLLPSTQNVGAYSKVVQDKFFKRTLIETASEILEEARSDAEESDIILDSAEQKIYNIRQGRNSSSASRIGDIIVDKVVPHLTNLSGPDREKYLGTPSGWGDLDAMISGLNRSDLIIVGARPAMGKTSFALNLAANVSKKGNKVLFFSLEMTKEQLAERVISMEARIHGQKMRNGRLSTQDWTNFSTVAGAINEIPLYFDDTSNITVNEMKARIRREKDVDVVIIDYLQLMQAGGRVESRVQEVSQITRSLKLMAKDLEVPVIVLCQLSRNTERAGGKNHRPQLADLRESGSIEQDADIVLMLYRDDYYQQPGGEEENMDRNDINTVEIIVAKNRHGPVGSVDLAWNSEFTLFTSIEKRDDDIFA
ncbi:MAG: replicative DNA helicase [Clostridia bacterium]|nr:replicative DNA helicase [Clostridia bacterium]